MMNVKKVIYENSYRDGCETCDYGSSYISDIEIVFEDETTLKIETDQMYEYTLTESDFMQLLSNSVDLDDFYKNMFEMIEDKSYEIESRVSLQDMIIKINEKEIDIVKSCKTRSLVEKV
jgi:hypothetical protein